MVERPHSGLPGKVFACLSVLFVTVTAVNLSVSTLPSLREEEEQVRPSAALKTGSNFLCHPWEVFSLCASRTTLVLLDVLLCGRVCIHLLYLPP